MTVWLPIVQIIFAKKQRTPKNLVSTQLSLSSLVGGKPCIASSTKVLVNAMIPLHHDVRQLSPGDFNRENHRQAPNANGFDPGIEQREIWSDSDLACPIFGFDWHNHGKESPMGMGKPDQIENGAWQL